MSRPRKRSELRAVVPLWAQRIAVERQGDSLLIKGWGRIGGIVEGGKVGAAPLDLLQQFKRDAVRTLGKGSKSRGAGVYRFANADNDEKLIRFCEEFGPICGEVVSKRYDDDWTLRLTVKQSLEKLRDSRKQFAAAVELVNQVNRNGRADRSIIYAAEEEILRQTARDKGSYEHETFTAVDLHRRIDDGRPISNVLPFAHLMICNLLNKFPPDLAPVNGDVIELPTTWNSGIEHVLYYQLRRDYLAQREIGSCQECGEHFPVFKHGTRGCSDSCQRALRNRKYWGTNKKMINRGRRKERE